jgi:Putative esterase
MSSPSRWLRVAGFVAGLLAGTAAAQQRGTLDTTLRFEVTLAPGVLPEATDGRILVALSRDLKQEPRFGISHYNDSAAAVLGADARALVPGASVVLDQTSAIYPLTDLARLPAGMYAVQALLHHNRDLCVVNAPGDLFSAMQSVSVDPAKGGVVRLQLARAVPPDEVPADTENVKLIKLRSELLSRFHGRPMYLRAGVILPRDFGREAARRYPLRVHIGGYGSRYSGVSAMMAPGSRFRKTWLADDTPRMLLLHLDGAGPFGDPYQVNSANNGPYGDAIVRELIPNVEEKYRGIGAGHARVLDGASTGGWVSLALQIFYPEFFAGAWSRAPDPVDFRAFELLDIYKDDHAFVNAHGFERPASRELTGDVKTTMRFECQLERVLGRGDRWELSGMDWCAWNAVFGPRGADGLPRPLWDGKTGKLDRSVLEHWQKYDLRRVLQQNWPALAPKLRGKLHIAVGEADDYFLNNAVHLLDSFLRTARPAYEGSIVYGMGQGHSWDPQGETERMRAMAKAMESGSR